jgi:hypothetical protein
VNSTFSGEADEKRIPPFCRVKGFGPTRTTDGIVSSSALVAETIADSGILRFPAEVVTDNVAECAPIVDEENVMGIEVNSLAARELSPVPTV